MQIEEFKTAFKVSIPVMMGYIVLGFAFGLLVVSFHYAWYIALLMSIFIYAGALQFLAVGFFTAKLSLFDIFIASIFVNIRQSFYGLSLLKHFQNKFKPYLIFALTDETYALLSTIDDSNIKDKKYYYLYLSLLNQSYWILGSVAGAVFGSIVDFNTKGVEFSLTALFVVLAIEQYKKHKTFLPFLIGAISSLIAFSFVSIDNMLIVAILCSIIGLYIVKSRLENVK